MPELPEVETIRRDLEPKLAGRRITRVEIAPDRVPVLEGIDEATFREGLVGARIQGLSRRGKFLVFELDTGANLIVHLRMTGKLLLPDAPLVGHLRATLTFDDGSTLRFTDMRKFGRLWLVDSLSPMFDKIGPEPLTEGFTLDLLAAALKNRKAPVKSTILDQRRIAGIGNIYADEALFEAGVRPTRPGGALCAQGCEAPARRHSHRAHARRREPRRQLPRLRGRRGPVRRHADARQGVSTHGQGLLRLRHGDRAHSRRWPFDALLSEVPEMNLVGAIQSQL